MIDLEKIQQGMPVVLLKEPYAGRVGYFDMRYPYPDGEQFTVRLVEPQDTFRDKPEKVLISPDDAVQIKFSPMITPATRNFDQGNPTNNLYKIGTRVIVTSNDYRGYCGVITKIIPIAGGCLTNYMVDIDKTTDGSVGKPSIVVREEDLVPAGYTKVVVKGIDLGRFLSSDFLYSAAEAIYEEAIRDHVTKVIEARCFGSTTLTDWIIAEVAKRFADDLAPRFKDDFLTKIQKEIAREVPKDSDPNGETFHTMFTQALERCACKYIDDHIDEIGSLMHNAMESAAEKISVDTVASVMRRKVNIEQIVRDAFAEKPKEDVPNV